MESCVLSNTNFYEIKKMPKNKQEKKVKKEVLSRKKPINKPAPHKKNTGTKRARADGPAAKLAIAQAAFREIKPPAHIFLDDVELVFFDSIIAEFAKIEWSGHTIEIASFLARYMAKLDKNQMELSKEGSMIENKRLLPGKNGQPAKLVTLGKVINPREKLIDNYVKNIISLRRSISLHARAKDGDPRDAGKRRAAAKLLENALDDDDDLLAKPKTLN